MTKPTAQMINPRDAGLRGLDLKRPLFDEDTVARADNTLKAMGDSMVQWLDADVERLQQTRLAAENAHWSHAALETLGRVAHDLKGMGGTYGFPLVTQIAASLCRLVETEAGKSVAQADPSLVRAHVDALRAAVRDRIKTDGDPTGRALVHALEEEVAKLGVAPR